MAQIPIVDEQDNIIAYKERSEILPEDIYRISALWITNSSGEMLIAQRSLQKAGNPGRWGPAVAGTVEKGETYRENIIKEAEEELGLKNIDPIQDIKVRMSGKRNFFSQNYTLVLDISIEQLQLQEDEVAAARWISPEDLEREVEENPKLFVSSVALWLRKLKES